MVSTIHDKLAQSDLPVIPTEGGGLRCLQSGFNAHGVGEACRFSHSLLQSVAADPGCLFKDTIARVAELAGQEKALEAEHMLAKAAADLETGMFKWLGVYETLPLMMWELGGLRSRAMAYAFTNTYFPTLYTAEQRQQIAGELVE